VASSDQSSRRHVGLALLAAVLFGASAPFAKLLLRDAAPQLLAGLLYLGSGIGLTIVWLRPRRTAGAAREARLTRRDAPWLAGAIVFGGALGPLLLMVGLTRTQASSASLLLNLEGAFTALLAWFVFRENFDRRIALGMLAIVAGGVPGRARWLGSGWPGRSPSRPRASAGRSTTTSRRECPLAIPCRSRRSRVSSPGA
jgi:drug/metabolite transporter (DMT)-like permease